MNDTATNSGAGDAVRPPIWRRPERVLGELRPYPETDGDRLDAMLLLARRHLAPPPGAW